jgi:hypothetical protein
MVKHIAWIGAEEKELEKKIFSEYSTDNIRKHIEYLTTLRRMAGTEDELQAARYIENALDGYGIDSQIHEFDAYISHPGKAELEIIAPFKKSIPCLPRIFITPSPPEGLEAEVVFVGSGSDENYQKVNAQGKIVLVMPGPHAGRVIAAQKAEAQGAIAQIHITKAKPGVIGCGQTRNIWGNPAPETLDKVPKTPAVAICYEDGNDLAELIQKGAVVVRLKADAWRGFGKIRVPVGKIPGAEEPEKFFLLAGHYCSWFIGATDNSAANALMLEMARIFSRYRRHLKRGIRLAWWSGHEQGTYAGSTWYLDTFWDEIRDHGIGYLAMDGIGRIGSSGFDPQNTEEIRKFYESVIRDVLGLETQSKRVSKIGDQSYLGMGLPSFTGKPGFTDEQKAGDLDPVWYGHTAEDTLDKLDMDLIRVPFKVNSAAILRLCNGPVLPYDFITVADMFETGLDDIQKVNPSALNLDAVTSLLEQFKGNVKALHLMIDTVLTQYEKKKNRPDLEDRFKAINTCLIKLGRILMPVLATQAGKYGQDPMGTPFRPIPILRPIEKLERMDSENEEYKALRTLLVRERNKLSDALNWANRPLNFLLTGS